MTKKIKLRQRELIYLAKRYNALTCGTIMIFKPENKDEEIPTNEEMRIWLAANLYSFTIAFQTGVAHTNVVRYMLNKGHMVRYPLGLKIPYRGVDWAAQFVDPLKMKMPAMAILASLVNGNCFTKAATLRIKDSALCSALVKLKLIEKVTTTFNFNLYYLTELGVKRYLLDSKQAPLSSAAEELLMQLASPLTIDYQPMEVNRELLELINSQLVVSTYALEKEWTSRRVTITKKDEVVRQDLRKGKYAQEAKKHKDEIAETILHKESRTNLEADKETVLYVAAKEKILNSAALVFHYTFAKAFAELVNEGLLKKGKDLGVPANSISFVITKLGIAKIQNKIFILEWDKKIEVLTKLARLFEENPKYRITYFEAPRIKLINELRICKLIKINKRNKIKITKKGRRVVNVVNSNN